MTLSFYLKANTVVHTSEGRGEGLFVQKDGLLIYVPAFQTGMHFKREAVWFQGSLTKKSHIYFTPCASRWSCGFMVSLTDLVTKKTCVFKE